MTTETPCAVGVVTIRGAVEADLPEIVTMGCEFLAGVEYADVLHGGDPARMRETAGRLIASDDAALFVAEKDGCLVGMIGLLAYIHPISGRRVASEVMWFVRAEHRGGVGLQLLGRAEAWARAADATALHMIAPTDRVGRIYEARGYRRVEAHFALSLIGR